MVDMPENSNGPGADASGSPLVTASDLKINLTQNASGAVAVGCVSEVTGVAEAVDSHGAVRVLLPGDFIYANETVKGQVSMMSPTEFQKVLGQMHQEAIQDISLAEQQALSSEPKIVTPNNATKTGEEQSTVIVDRMGDNTHHPAAHQNSPANAAPKNTDSEHSEKANDTKDDAEKNSNNTSPSLSSSDDLGDSFRIQHTDTPQMVTSTIPVITPVVVNTPKVVVSDVHTAQAPTPAPTTPTATALQTQFSNPTLNMVEASLNRSQSVSVSGSSEVVNSQTVSLNIHQAFQSLLAQKDPNASVTITVGQPGIVINQIPGYEFKNGSLTLTANQYEAMQQQLRGDIQNATDPKVVAQYQALYNGSLIVSTTLGGAAPNDQNFNITATVQNGNGQTVSQYNTPVVVSAEADGLMLNSAGQYTVQPVTNTVSVGQFDASGKPVVTLTTNLNLQFSNLQNESHVVSIQLPNNTAWAPQLQSGWTYDTTSHILTIPVPTGASQAGSYLQPVVFQAPLADYIQNYSHYDGSIGVSVESTVTQTDSGLAGQGSVVQSVSQPTGTLPGFDFLHPQTLVEHSSETTQLSGAQQWSFSIAPFVQLLGQSMGGSLSGNASISFQASNYTAGHAPTIEVILPSGTITIPNNNGVYTLDSTVLQSILNSPNASVTVTPAADSSANFNLAVSVNNFPNMPANITVSNIPITVESIAESWDSASISATTTQVTPDHTTVQINFSNIQLGNAENNQTYTISMALPSLGSGSNGWSIPAQGESHGQWQIVTVNGVKTLQGTLTQKDIAALSPSSTDVISALPIQLQASTQNILQAQTSSGLTFGAPTITATVVDTANTGPTVAGQSSATQTLTAVTLQGLQTHAVSGSATVSVAPQDASVFEIKGSTVQMPLTVNASISNLSPTESLQLTVSLPAFTQLVVSGMNPDFGVSVLNTNTGLPGDAHWSLSADGKTATVTLSPADIQSLVGTSGSNLSVTLPIQFNSSALPSMKAGDLTTSVSATIIEQPSPAQSASDPALTSTTVPSNTHITVTTADLEPSINQLTQSVLIPDPAHPGHTIVSAAQFNPSDAVKHNQAVVIDISQTLTALKSSLNQLLSDVAAHGYPPYVAGDVRAPAAAEAAFFNQASINTNFFSNLSGGTTPLIYGGGNFVGSLTTDSAGTHSSVNSITGSQLQAIYNNWIKNPSDPFSSDLLVTSAPGSTKDLTLQVSSSVPSDSIVSSGGTSPTQTVQIQPASSAINVLSYQNYNVAANAPKPIVQLSSELTDLHEVNGTQMATITFNVSATFPNASGQENSTITVNLKPSDFIDPSTGQPIETVDQFNALMGNYMGNTGTNGYTWQNLGNGEFALTIPNNSAVSVNTSFSIEIPSIMLPVNSVAEDGTIETLHSLSVGDSISQGFSATATATTTVLDLNPDGTRSLNQSPQGTSSSSDGGDLSETIIEVIPTANLNLSVPTNAAQSAALAVQLSDLSAQGKLAAIDIKSALSAFVAANPSIFSTIAGSSGALNLAGSGLSNAKLILTVEEPYATSTTKPPVLYFNEINANFSPSTATPNSDSGYTYTYTLSGSSLVTALIQYQAQLTSSTPSSIPAYLQVPSGDILEVSVQSTNGNNVLYTSGITQVIAQVTNQLISENLSATITPNYVPTISSSGSQAEKTYVHGTAADSTAVNAVSLNVKLQFADKSSSANREVVIQLPSDFNFNWNLLAQNGSLNGWTLIPPSGSIGAQLVKIYAGTSNGAIQDTVNVTFNASVLQAFEQANPGKSFSDSIQMYTASTNAFIPIQMPTSTVDTTKMMVASQNSVDPSGNFSASGSTGVTITQGITEHISKTTSSIFNDTAGTHNTYTVADNFSGVIQTKAGNDTIIGGQGGITVRNDLSNATGNDVLIGGNGRNFLASGSGNDVLYANGSNSTAGFNIDTTTGNVGYITNANEGNTYNIWAGGTKLTTDHYALTTAQNTRSSSTMIENNALGVDISTKSQATATLDNITNILTGGAGNDIINTNNPTSAAKAGSLVLAGQGNDTIVSGWGSDIIFLNGSNGLNIQTNYAINSAASGQSNPLNTIGTYDIGSYALAKQIIHNLGSMKSTDMWGGTADGAHQADQFTHALYNFRSYYVGTYLKSLGITDPIVTNELFTQKVAYILYSAEQCNIVTGSAATQYQSQMGIFSTTVLPTSNPNVTNVYTFIMQQTEQEDRFAYGAGQRMGQLGSTMAVQEYNMSSQPNPNPYTLPQSLFGYSNSGGSNTSDIAGGGSLTIDSSTTTGTFGSMSIVNHYSVHNLTPSDTYTDIATAMQSYANNSLQYQQQYTSNTLNNTDTGNPNYTMTNNTLAFSSNQSGAGSDTIVYTLDSILNDHVRGTSTDTLYNFNYTSSTSGSSTTAQDTIDISQILDTLGVSSESRTNSMITFNNVNVTDPTGLNPTESATQIILNLRAGQITNKSELAAIQTEVNYESQHNTSTTNTANTIGVTGQGGDVVYHFAIANIAGVSQENLQANLAHILVLQSQSGSANGG